MAERARVAIVSAVVAVLIGSTSPAVGSIVVPDPARPVIAMAQTTDLVDGQRVRVTGSGFLRGEHVGFSLCVRPCTGSTGPPVIADRHGQFDTQVRMRRFLPEYMDRYPLDCAYARCTFDAVRYDGQFEDGYLSLASLAVAFRPGDQVGTATEVSPRSGLHSGDTVAVSVHGVVPSSAVTVQLCRGTATGAQRGERCELPIGVTANAGGAVVTPLTVQAGWGTADCRDATTVCTVRVGGSGGATTLALSFDRAGRPPPPVLAVTSQPGTAERATVGVTGSGFTAGGEVRIAQCEQSSGVDGCLPSTGVTADAAGRVRATLAVTRYVGPGLIDCAHTACVVRALDGDPGPAARAAVRFLVDPTLPSVSLRGAVVAEGATTSTARVRVALDRVPDHPVTFSWEAPGLSAPGRATIPPGSDHVDLTVTVPGDTFDNENRTHFLRLTGIDGAQLGATGGTTEIWIVDDDPPPSISLAPGLAAEHDGYVSLPVRVTQRSHRFIELAYRTRSRSAVDGRDFVGGTGVVSVKSYDGEGTIDIPIVNDAAREGPERFVVELTEVRRAEVGRRRAVVWIVDDD